MGLDCVVNDLLGAEKMLDQFLSFFETPKAADGLEDIWIDGFY